MKTLKETIPGMLSKDPSERLVAEIEQVDIRLYNLERHMEKIGEDSPEYSLLQEQMTHMTEYLRTLTARATAFGIDYTLPSLSERMKNMLPFPPDVDPMFWLFVLFYLSMRKEDSKWY